MICSYVTNHISLFFYVQNSNCALSKSTRDEGRSPLKPTPKFNSAPAPAPEPEPISDFVPSLTATANPTSLEEEEMEFVSTETENGWCLNDMQCPRSNERCISNRCVIESVTCRRGRDCLSNERCNTSGYCVRDDKRARDSGDTCNKNGDCGAHQHCNSIGHCERRQAAMETSRGLRGRN